jgi:hypothetical protein
MGELLDILKGATQRAARGGERIREVDHFDPQRGKIAFERLALFSALPVAALEQDVESNILSGLDLVVRHCGQRRIDEAHTADDLEPFYERNNGCEPFVSNEHIVGHDAGDQIVAMLLGAAEEIEMADVEEVESPRGIAGCVSSFQTL